MLTMPALKYQMLGKPEVAALLGCGERALERLIENRRFPPGRRYGRCTLWFESTVDAFLMAEQRAQRAWLIDGAAADDQYQDLSSVPTTRGA